MYESVTNSTSDCQCYCTICTGYELEIGCQKTYPNKLKRSGAFGKKKGIIKSHLWTTITYKMKPKIGTSEYWSQQLLIALREHRFIFMNETTHMHL